MRRSLEARLARFAKEKTAAERARRYEAAEHRQRLRAWVALAALLRRRLAPADRGAAFARVQERGAAAAAELAHVPDTARMRRADQKILDTGDVAGAAEDFMARLETTVARCRDSGTFDLDRAAPAELLARCLVRSIEA
ncbi:MAG TPA: hypothetical protein VJ770_26565 [Stellaceae bacterium]|nr:hypothetical protein [Stellaceae bacterium]